MSRMRTPDYRFSPKHREYMRKSLSSVMNVAEGAVRAGKTVDNVFAFAYLLETAPDRFHLATGATIANAKLNIGDCNGLGLEAIFRGRCRWGKYRDNECLRVSTASGEKIVIFAGGGKADSYRRIRGNSYGMWIATEINLHHDSMIKEAFNRQLAASRRRVFWDLNPDNPNAPIYRDYIDKYAASGLPGGYNYAHFTIRDNPLITPERLREIEAQYDKDSVWYRRDILGERTGAEGVIFRRYADSPERFTVPWSGFTPEEKKELCAGLDFISVGVDFGGNRSLTTFAAAAFSHGFGAVYMVADRHIEGRKGDIDGETVNREFVRFVRDIGRELPDVPVRFCFADSEAQYLINGLRRAAENAGLGLRIGDSAKYPIVERIRCCNSLIGAGRFYVFDTCTLIPAGLGCARWDPGAAAEGKDVRLDNFSTDIDILDAEEYSWERFIPKLIPKRKEKEMTSIV